MEEKETPENTTAEADDQDTETGVVREESMEPEAELSQEIDHYKALAQRAQADLVNYRNRATQEIEETKRIVQFGLLSRFISILDDLERAIQDLVNY